MSARFDQHRFEELIIFLARRCEDDTTFGATKLNKLLFFADFTAYRKLGYALTGAIYQKLEYGPAPIQLVPTRTVLFDRGDLLTVRRNYFGKEQQRLIAGREADLSKFNGEEVALIDEIIDNCRDLNATSISRLSHDYVGWKAVEYGDVIPYETAKVQPEQLSHADLEKSISLKVAKWNDSTGWERIPSNAPLE